MKTASTTPQAPAAAEPFLVHEGMPPLPLGPRYPAFKRRLSDRQFYALPALMWASLAARYGSLTLPSAANPSMEVGGLWGERKSVDLAILGPRAERRVAPYVALVRGDDAEADLRAALAALKRKRMRLPVVAKPDRGYQGWGVRRVDDVRRLRSFIESTAPGGGYLLQTLVLHGGEAGVFYIRKPREEIGRIVSLALVYAPHVVGDGRSSPAALVAADPVLAPNAALYRERHAEHWEAPLAEGETLVLTNARSARLGAVYRDATDLVTPALRRAIEEIARDIPNFHFGRFDIRFRSLDALRRGQDFMILELNGAGAEMLHIWDARSTLGAAYRALWSQYRALFAIGAEMRRRGHRPADLRTMMRLQREQERLRRGYLPTT